MNASLSSVNYCVLYPAMGDAFALPVCGKNPRRGLQILEKNLVREKQKGISWEWGEEHKGHQKKRKKRAS